MAKKPRRRPQTGASRHDRQDRILQDKLVFLWHKLAAPKQPPAIDRFLARELGRLDGLNRTDRLWLGDLLTDALRFGALTVFAESWRRDGWLPEVTAQDRLSQRAMPLGTELWQRLTRLPPAIVFFWTFMRKRLTGSELPPIAPPGPHATEVWRVLRQEAPTSEALPLRALWAGLPPQLTPLINQRAQVSGWRTEQTLRFIDQHALRPPVWLRVLNQKDEDNLLRELATAGFAVQKKGAALEVRGAKGVFELPAYRRGTFEIQDLASQRIGEAVAAQPGDLVWDCCAGAGGKSLQVAAGMQDRGLVYATDLHEGKLKDLRRRAKRTGLAIIKDNTWSGNALPDFHEDSLESDNWDWVLVDAPCSGCGTWRRNVDGRLRLTPSAVTEFSTVQRQLLSLAAQATRPGGRLVYATCSWLPAENEDVCAAFLAEYPHWRCEASGLAGNPDADSDTTFWAVFTH